ncbi:MAG: DUF3575 domain-containing protein [Flavobacterium sp. JAD_PAG50586_2]|nr:MAG: DUF3575 domain-containing protein [Flavobacterium sp. JAD_PAG50586_2]
MFQGLIIKKFLFSMLYSLTFIHAAAQHRNADNNIIVTLSPLALADVFDGASVRLGTEVKLRRNISVAVEAGAYAGYLKSTKIDPKGFLVRPSIKYYLNKQQCSGRYLALEYQFKHQTFDMRDSIVIHASRFEKQYGMRRTIHSAVFKYGKLKNIGEKFVLEWYCGVGIRHIRSHSDLSTEEEDGILTGEEGDCPIQEDIIRLTGTRIFPDFRVGIKVGLRLK